MKGMVREKFYLVRNSLIYLASNMTSCEKKRVGDKSYGELYFEQRHRFMVRNSSFREKRRGCGWAGWGVSETYAISNRIANADWFGIVPLPERKRRLEREENGTLF